MNDFEQKLIAKVEETVIKTVNGKIDALKAEMRNAHETQTKAIDKLNETLEEHLKKVEPVVDSLDLFRIGRNFLLWLAAPIVAVGIIVAWFKGLIHRL